MIIDFEKIAEAHIEGFKGGEGKLDTRNYVDCVLEPRRANIAMMVRLRLFMC